ncbi:hypothetical protein QJS10_CPA05g02224 [Acorus calamus]|uniref:Uncharacterized protein n=1 Tax=Acorus calamus TaxID=4465 RepID=A0AAV9ETI6_ACOCL|nr:hypothetical protein QJS10_CPA05g02224 [Acorus calamus]
MMKKGRRVLMEASASYVVGEDEKMRIKIRDLTEEYEVLEKETEAIQVRLQREKHKKLNLLAEVRFLQRRYKYLLENPPHIPPPTPFNQSKKPDIPFKSPAPRPPPKRFATHDKKNLPRNPNQKKPPRHSTQTLTSGTLLRRQVQKGALKRFPSQTPKSLPAIPLQRNNHMENEGGRMTPHGVLDLNQISHLRPEETGEFQVAWEPLGGEKNLKQALVDGDSESGDVNLSICRDVGGSSRMGKRKISWQDQVALRV